MLDYTDHPYAHFFLLLSDIQQSSKRIIETKLKKRGITWPQFTVLAALSQNDKITQRQLGEVIETDSTTVMVICDSLEEKGLINRLPNPHDRRSNLIELTDRGKQKAWETTPLFGEQIQLFSTVLSLEEVAEINLKLQGLLKIVKEA